MDWLYFILLIVFSLGGFVLGWRYVGRLKGRYWIPIAGGSLGLVFLYILFRLQPALEFHLIPLWIGPAIDIISWIPFATLFLGIAARKATSRFLPIEVACLALIIFGYGLMRVNWVFMGNGVDPTRFCVNKDGVCFQSTSYTCGAAGAVTFLRYYGIEATEKEMADLSHTRYGLGVETVPLARAVAQKAKTKGLQVDIITADWATLKQLNRPCMVDMKWSFMVDHLMVVLKADESGVIMADPLAGKKHWSKQEFLDKWRGSAIVIK